MMKPCTSVLAALLVAVLSRAQTVEEPSEARPAVTSMDLKIAKRAREILNTPAKWNRSDTRICPPQAKRFSLYCTIEKATSDVGGYFEHRSAAMQEARMVIEEVYPDWRRYEHRLKDYNNDPRTTFADIQKVLRLLEEHISERLREQQRRSGR